MFFSNPRTWTALLVVFGCVPALAQGLYNADAITQNFHRFSLPAPTAANTTVEPRIAERRCYDAALKEAYKATQGSFARMLPMNFKPAEVAFEATLDKAGSEHRGSIMTALASTAGKRAFLDALPASVKEGDMASLNALHDAFTQIKIGVTDYFNDATCQGNHSNELRPGNPLVSEAAPGYYLTGLIEKTCDCEAEGQRIKSFTIRYWVPAEWLYVGGDAATSMSLTLNATETQWMVETVNCCRKPKDEEEEPRSALEPESPSLGAVNSPDPIALENDGHGCLGNAPFDGANLTGFTGFSGTRPFPDASTTDFMVGLKAGYPIIQQSAIVGLDAMLTNTTFDNNSSFGQNSFTASFAAFLDWYFGCDGPVSPYVGVAVPLHIGSESFDNSGPFPITVKDNVLGYGVSLHAGLTAKISDNWAIGLEAPLLGYIRESRKPAGSNIDPIAQGQFTQSLNQQIPSINLTYDFGGSGYTIPDVGFDLFENGLFGCGGLTYGINFSEEQKASFTGLASGVMYPVTDGVLVGGNVKVNFSRERLFFDSGLGSEEYYRQRDISVIGEVMTQYYPFDTDGPVDPLVGATFHAGSTFGRQEDPFALGETVTTNTSRLLGASLQVGAYWDVADNWGVVGSFPLVSWAQSSDKDENTGERFSNSSWRYGINKPVASVQVFYDLCGGKE